MKRVYFLLFLFIVIICIRVPAQNVGIGTSNPVTKLDVNVSFRVTSDYISAMNAPTRHWLRKMRY